MTLDFRWGTPERRATTLPLFPLTTVLFPGGRLPLRIFEQRYIAMAKTCLADGLPFGVCQLTRGREVAVAASGPPEFATIGTFAAIGKWDMPQLGILHVRADGGSRYRVLSHSVRDDGLVVGDVASIAAEPTVAVGSAHEPLVRLLQLLVERVGDDHLAPERAYGDATWLGYRLAELLPLPLSIKQHMLEINDALVRLEALKRFLAQHALL